MEYLTPEQAQDLPGLRLVLTAGVPGPWGEAAKAIFRYKGIPFTPVAQLAGQANEALVRWTGFRNAPVAIYEDERPIDRWSDILFLAERLRPEPTLLPANSFDRALVFGISNEMCGEKGLAWWRRALMITASRAPDAEGEPDDFLSRTYRISAAAAKAAPGQCINILTMLSERLKGQERAGSPYFVGDAFTAADLYWTYFSVMLDPPPQEVNPMPDWLRPVYATVDPVVMAVLDPILIRHRDLMFERHLPLPLEF